MKKNSLFFILFILIISTTYAKRKKDKNAPQKDSLTKRKSSIEEFTKRCKKYDGLFVLYQDTLNGSLYLLITKSQFNKEYIYFSNTVNAISGIGFRGSYRANDIIVFRKNFDRIDLVKLNTSFYYNPTSPLSKSSNANVSHSIVVSERIESQDESKGFYLIKADNIYLTESLDRIKYNSSSSSKLGLGSLNKEKTRYTKLKNFTSNTDVEVEYVYDNYAPTITTQNDVADVRYVSITLYHSFVEIPNPNFKPRRYDARVAHNHVTVEDLTSLQDYHSYNDFIHKWHLVKKDSSAQLSEPVEPITFWIENTTPYEFRETIKEAVLKWNNVFEKIGFKNVIQVFIQPDTAAWEAEDIHYNVIRWVPSPHPAVGGLGPQLVDPRTGQIIASDILLEYLSIRNRINYSSLVDNGFLEDVNGCQAAAFLNYDENALLITLDTEKESSVKEKLMKQFISYLVIHETGHALGLAHNFMGGMLYSIDDLKNNQKEVYQNGLAGSIMDYFTSNYLFFDESKDNFIVLPDQPGICDYWSIECAYADELANDQKRLQKIASQLTNPIFQVGYGEEAMNQLDRGIDPRVMLFDWSNDPISYEIEKIKFLNKKIIELKSHYLKKNSNQPYTKLAYMYANLVYEKNLSSLILSRYIGGVFVNKNWGPTNFSKPFTPVSYDEQKKAMQTLSTYFFSVENKDLPIDLFPYLKREKRGNELSHYEDTKIHDAILTGQRIALVHLLSTTTLKRIINTSIYGNTYTIDEMMADLTTALFKKDLTKNISTLRQNIQLDYIDQLIAHIESSYDKIIQRVAFQEIKKIEKMMASTLNKSDLNSSTNSHKLFILQKIKHALSNN